MNRSYRLPVVCALAFSGPSVSWAVDIVVADRLVESWQGYGLAGAVTPAPTLQPPAASFALAVVLGLLLVMGSGAWRQGRRAAG